MPKVNWKTGVYQWRNTVNGKVYVGGAYSSFERRKRRHLELLRAGKSKSPHFQAAWNKYGEAAFVFEVLERCPLAGVQAAEQRWLDKVRPWRREVGYNVSRTACRVSFEVPEVLAEVGARISAARAGHEVSAETREKISRSLTGRKMSAALRARLSASQNRPTTRALKSSLTKEQWRRMTARQKKNCLAACLSQGAKNFGENHGASVLTDEKVREARSLRASDPKFWTFARLQKRYGCGFITIYKAVSGISWRHVK